MDKKELIKAIEEGFLLKEVDEKFKADKDVVLLRLFYVL